MSQVEMIPLDNKDKNLGYKGIQDRRTPELVFAFVEPIGGGAKHAQDLLSRLLSEVRFGYIVNQISISRFIEEEARACNYESPALHPMLVDLPFPVSDEAKRINRLQQLGNRLRSDRGNDFLAKKAIQSIANYRHDNGMEQAEGGAPVPKPIRVVHVIRSLKHRAELELIKAVYGDLFFLVGVSSEYGQQVRNYRVLEDSDDQNDRAKQEYNVLSKIDQDEGVGYGQQVRDVFYKSNLFINGNEQPVEESISLFLDLLFGKKVGSPSCDERMMFEAFSASLRSTCLSRQVGAAISDNNGEFVSIGWNDIPAFKGGLATDQHPAHKAALCKSKGVCRSNREIDKLLSLLFDSLKKDKLLLAKTSKEKVKLALKKGGISNLIEFSRAIHAEMEAILSAARTGRKGLLGGTLYVTTYPCENCVKHILAAGIERVVYIEPYPKSRAIAFFSDFVAGSHESGGEKLQLSQFVGVSPRSYPLLYHMNNKRKDETGGLLVNSSRDAMPITNVLLDNFAIYENKIANEV